MPRTPRPDEIDLVLRLVGPDFAEIDIIKEQIHKCLIEEVCDGNIREFHPIPLRRMKVTRKLLGEGAGRDADGTPIVFSLLQKDGYIWRLDISRVDGQRLQGPLNYAAVVALGSGRGLSLDEADKHEV
jgi:hypothetical protein